jgi:hypothetical protein
LSVDWGSKQAAKRGSLNANLHVIGFAVRHFLPAARKLHFDLLELGELRLSLPAREGKNL